jgi:hypothetical protein
MTEPATVFWYPPKVSPTPPDSKVVHGKERMFESVENAAIFVMETLSERDRGSAMIQTAQRSIHQPDIEAIYAGIKPRD